ncbi:hypothetical protein GCM10027422_41650 [Hymenobacter arcticus]
MGLLAGGLSSCLKAPEYPTTPSISFNRVEVRRTNFANPQQQPIDSMFITINFQDGDGDLGLTEAESKVAPYAFPSLFNNNYFIEPVVKDPKSGKFFTPIDPATGKPLLMGSYNGRFDHPSTLTDGKAAPLKGTLTRTIGFGYGDVFTAGQVVRFDVSIADRALHLSNVIRTDSIVIAKR